MTHAETSGAENRLRKIDEELARRHQTSRGNMKLLDDLKIKLLLKLHDPNYEEEIDYWRRYLAKDRLTLFDASIKRKAFPAFLKHEVNEFRERHGRAPRLLEVGSGPVSLLIDGVETGEIDVLAVDPLGDQYAKASE